MLTGSASPSSLFLSTFQLTLGAEKLGQCDTSHHRFTVTPPPSSPSRSTSRTTPLPFPPLHAHACRCTSGHTVLPDDLLQSC